MTAEAKPHLGIPEAVFLDDVDKYMANEESAKAVITRFDEMYQKYKMMEANLMHKKQRLKTQIPEIRSTLDIVKHLNKRKDSTDPMTTQFLLAGALRAKATIPPTNQVCLWLGANVMLTYDIEDALALLNKNLETAKNNLKSVNDDLDFLRDQCTTSEVNLARVYNWDVKRRQAETKKK